MYEEAATLASCVIKQRAPDLLTDDDLELYEAMEAAGMVFVQSLKQLSRSHPFIFFGFGLVLFGWWENVIFFFFYG